MEDKKVLSEKEVAKERIESRICKFEAYLGNVFAKNRKMDDVVDVNC